MNVEDVLRGKSLGSGESGPVATIRPDSTVADVVVALREQNIGALVVSSDGSHVDGIISERDIVRLLGEGSTPIVASEGRMVGIVSIGDVVKSRLDQLEEEKARLADENESITEYIQTGR